MDGFAQTRGADDLFDDDFTPMTEPEHQIYQPVEEPSQPPAPPPQEPQPNNHFYDQVPRGPKNASRPPGQTSRRPPKAPSTPTQPPPTTSTTTTTAPNATIESNNTDPSNQAPPSTEPSIPRPLRPAAAVRGDRLATGGTPKPKLTEEELTAKLAAAKLNNEKRAEAHRLAEADEASFQQREAKATERRKEEGKAKRAMDMEREKNRLRKLEAGARGGREWDEGKEEQRRDSRGGYRRGANGGIGGMHVGDRFGAPSADDGVDEQYAGRGARGGNGGRGQGRGRGRGDRVDRGRGGGGQGSGRGGGGNRVVESSAIHQKAPDPIIDFPALPSGPKPSGDSLPADKVGESLKSPLTNGASWADQVNDRES